MDNKDYMLDGSQATEVLNLKVPAIRKMTALTDKENHHMEVER